MRIEAADGVARILKAEGVEWITTFPGCIVNNALGREGVAIIMMRDERYAVAVADAYSRITGGKRIGVCAVQGGANPGGLQIAYGALAQAYVDSSPVLCIANGVPVGTTGRDRYDITTAFASVTKWAGHIDMPCRVPEFMRRAFTELRTGRPGPVLITVPRGPAEYDDEEHPYKPVKGWRWGPDPADVEAAVEALLTAKRPLLYAGEGVYYGDAAAELRCFAELAQTPVLVTLKAKSVFPENHPLYIGVRGEPARQFLEGCDLVFAIGTSLESGGLHHVIPDAGHKTIVHCTVDPSDVNRYYQTDYAVIGDARLSLLALIDELSRRTGGGRQSDTGLLAEIQAARDSMMAKFGPLMASDQVPINPYRVYGDLMKVLDRERAFVTHDSGNTRDQLSTVYQALMPRGFAAWGNVTTLGFGLAAAMAAKLAHPDWQCVNVTGDAGVGYMMGNFEALVRNQIGVTTVHINNGGFAGYGPGFWGKGSSPYTWEVSDHSVADMSEAVKAMGYYAEDITEPTGIIPALRRALEANEGGRPAYLEILCSQYPVYGAWVIG